VFSGDLQEKVCFLVDDICDSGKTIVGVATALKELHAKKIIFIVSHGIFSKGYPLQNVDEIYCTNSYKPIASVDGDLTVMNVLKYFC
jgi:ribose-phosphate pyrophosphokinase